MLTAFVLIPAFAGQRTSLDLDRAPWRSRPLLVGADACAEPAGGGLVVSRDVRIGQISPSRRAPTRYRVVRESLYNQVCGRADGDIVDLKFRKGKVPRQTAVDLSTPGAARQIPYSRKMLAAASIQPEPRRVLQLEFGGGGMNRYLRKVMPGVYLQTAEIDATARDMAWNLARIPAGRPEDVVVIEDARTFVRKNTETWTGSSWTPSAEAACRRT